MTIAETKDFETYDVLVVDDDHDFADSLAQLLQLEGYRVGTAYSMKQAEEQLAQHATAVALVDIKLGRDSGLHLLQSICSHHPETVTVIMTAYASIDTAVEALQAGAYDYLCKPFFTEDLLTTLNRCLERRRLTAEREEAEMMLRASNREINTLNRRLSEVLHNIQLLSRFERRHLIGNAPDDSGHLSTTHVLYKRLLDAVVQLFDAQKGGIYLTEGHVMRPAATVPSVGTEQLELTRSQQALLEEAISLRKPVVHAKQTAQTDYGSNCSLLAFPMFDNRGRELGGLLVDGVSPHDCTQQVIELGQILISFGAEAIQAAEATERLAESEERLRKIVNNSPSAICLKDLEGRYLLTNSRYDEWFRGACRPDAIAAAVVGGHAAGDGIEPEELPDDNVIRVGKAASREVERTLTDGTRHWLLVTKFPVVDEHGEAVGVGTIATDVTEQRLAEQRLRQSQRIEAVGQLTEGVAHDFNNLLAVILGNLRLLYEEIGDRPDVAELLEEALEATKAGAELTGRLLAFGRGQPIRPQVADIGALVRDMSGMMERILGGSIAIRLDLAPDLWNANIDSNQLEASLLNLAINARDAMPNGGELIIRASNLKLEESEVGPHSDVRPGCYISLSITDTGEGMTPEVLSRAIHPFFTTKEPGHGSGLGLSMVYSFVTQSGGQMEIASETAKGTCVLLYLPVSSTAARASDRRGAPARSGHGERILVVEDQPGVRRLASRLLTRLGYEVVEAPDGRTALKILEENSGIRVLFTDIVLPGDFDGVALGKWAVTMKPTLKIIYTTGFATKAEALRADGSAVILRKPVQTEELSRALRAALDSPL